MPDCTADNNALSELERLVEAIGRTLSLQKSSLVTAESCTGGLLAAALTKRAGASSLFERGFITYSNDAKKELLGVPAEILKVHGAVSEPTARAMAKGALRNSCAQIAVAITGIAGPGGCENKPVGLVYIAYSDQHGGVKVHCHHFSGDRDTIRAQAVTHALSGLIMFVANR